MLNKDITMKEFAHGIYIAGIAQYNEFLDWFRDRGIKVNFEKLVFITGLINERIFEKVLKDEKIKIEGNLLDEIIKSLNDTIPIDSSQEKRKEVAKYIKEANNKIESILNKENSKFADTIDYFLSEIIEPPIDTIEIAKILVVRFQGWEIKCYDLIRKFKVEK